jgi:hypothetical protein
MLRPDLQEDEEVSGALVPYHQRQNKAVDRHLFVEILMRLNRRVPIAKYTYVSFGGAFLEDFKLMHAAFGNSKLISLEQNETAWKRQLFNLPLSCIQCLRQKSGDFVDTYAIATNAIIWLDYAAARKTREQLGEFQALLPKLREFDIVKITMNVNLDTLRSAGTRDQDGKIESAEVLGQKRFEELQRRIGDFMPQRFNAQSMTPDEYPRVLLSAIEAAANEALKGRPTELFQPLAAFVYSDLTHHMLTVSGIVLKKSERGKFLQDCDLKSFKLASPKWGEYKRIMLPALTARERLFIDQRLPKWGGKSIQKRLKFLFDPDEKRSVEILQNYIQFYRQYPNFHRVVF